MAVKPNLASTPVQPKTNVVPQLELPPNLDKDKLPLILNDRFRDLQEALKRFVQNPALGAVDLGTFRIINLQNPTDDLDAVNLRTLKQFTGKASTSQQQTSTAATGLDHYAIPFTFDGALATDGLISPSYTVIEGREGTPARASMTCEQPPTSGNLHGNFLVDGVQLLTSDLVIVVGGTGPVFSNIFNVPGRLIESKRIQGKIVTGSGAFQVVLELVVKRS